jgi:hypothetical protein
MHVGRRASWWFLVPVCAVVLGVAEAGAQSSIILPRPGQVGVGGHAQFGSLFESGDLGDVFDLGPGLGIRIRYRMRLERALGLVFESQSFDARDDTPDSLFAPDRLTALTSGIEIYQMFGTRGRTVRYLNAGVGLVQLSVRNHQDETEYPGDGLYASVGGGLERFVYRSTAIDLEAKYTAMFHEGETNHAVRVSAGVIFYVSY